MDRQPALIVEGLGLSYRLPQKGVGLGNQQTFTALEDISFEVHMGDVICLLGKNGAGKTSLLSVLAGSVKPSTGRIERFTDVGMFGPRFSLLANSSVRENGKLVALDTGESLHKVPATADQIVESAKLAEFGDFPFGVLSTGMKARLRFVAAMRYHFGVTLIDEGLTSSDQSFRDYVSRELGVAKGSREAYVVTDHNALGLAKSFNRALVLDRGRLIFDGPFQQGMREYEINLKGSSLGGASS